MPDTLLDYALRTEPSPLETGTPAILKLGVDNRGSRPVQVESITLILPVGTTGKALVADPTGIEVRVPCNWTSERDGGRFKLTPTTSEAGKIRGSGLEFVFARVGVNAEVGIARVTLDETAGEPGQPLETRHTVRELDKFPPRFHVSELTAHLEHQQRGLGGDYGKPGAPGRPTFVEVRPARKEGVRRSIPLASDTLLGYAVVDDPGPGGQSTLTLAESGGVPGVQSITVPLRLLAKPDGWTAAEEGGVTTLTPPAREPVPAATFTFLRPADAPRMLVVRERAGGQTRTAEFSLTPVGDAA